MYVASSLCLLSLSSEMAQEDCESVKYAFIIIGLLGLVLLAVLAVYSIVITIIYNKTQRSVETLGTDYYSKCVVGR